MLKVIIADDEERVCRMLQILPDWTALEMEVAATAANGIEALQAIERDPPDILITDIRMPGCDGLELIARAKQLAPEIEIIIISGYAHFEYAQSAMKYGVADYLLKPINRDELTATLSKLGKRRRDALVQAEQLRQDHQEAQNRVRSSLIHDLAQGKLDDMGAQALCERYHFACAPTYRAFVLKVDYDPEELGASTLAVLEAKAEECLHTAIRALCDDLAFGFVDSFGYGLIACQPERQAPIRRALRGVLNQLEAQKALFGAAAFSLALGLMVTEPSQIPRSLGTASQAVRERLLDGTGRLLEEVPTASALRESNLAQHYNRGIAQAVDTLDSAAAMQEVHTLEAMAMAVPDVRGSELLQLVKTAGSSFILRLNVEEREKILAQFQSRLELCSRAPQLFECLRKLQTQQLEAEEQRRSNESTRPIRIAKQYIQQHFEEPITLEDVCAACGYSNSYFSALFKKETGEGFSKYLTRLRMERAKELLRETALPVPDIGRQVGYSDMKHFTQTFKKLTLLSPGQYRKLYG
ncbi:MAG: response regulator transcription factor [Clostridia bacterium]